MRNDQTTYYCKEIEIGRIIHEFCTWSKASNFESLDFNIWIVCGRLFDLGEELGVGVFSLVFAEVEYGFHVIRLTQGNLGLPRLLLLATGKIIEIVLRKWS